MSICESDIKYAALADEQIFSSVKDWLRFPVIGSDRPEKLRDCLLWISPVPRERNFVEKERVLVVSDSSDSFFQSGAISGVVGNYTVLDMTTVHDRHVIEKLVSRDGFTKIRFDELLIRELTPVEDSRFLSMRENIRMKFRVDPVLCKFKTHIYPMILGSEGQEQQATLFLNCRNLLIKKILDMDEDDSKTQILIFQCFFDLMKVASISDFRNDNGLAVYESLSNVLEYLLDSQ